MVQTQANVERMVEVRVKIRDKVKAKHRPTWSASRVRVGLGFG